MDQASLSGTLLRGDSVGRVVFATENYDQIIDDLVILLPSHWAELAVHKDIPLDPDLDFYRIANQAGYIRAYTARLEGRLVGYSIFVVKKHPHYRGHKWALNDIVWIAPEHRKLGIGRAFVAHWDADLRADGVDVVHVNAKTAEPALSFLLSACGYGTTEVGLEKRLR